jgi:hypothetical protein
LGDEVADQLVQQNLSAGYANGTYGSGCTTLEMLWGNLTGDYSACVAENKAMVQAVGINAGAYYTPPVASLTQAIADQQSTQVPADVADAVASEPSYTDALGMGLGLSSYAGTPGSASNWVWWAAAAAALFAIVELGQR